MTLAPHVNPGREPSVTCLSEEFFNVVLMCVSVKYVHNVLDAQRAMLCVSIWHCICGTEYNERYLEIVDQKRNKGRDKTCFIKVNFNRIARIGEYTHQRCMTKAKSCLFLCVPCEIRLPRDLPHPGLPAEAVWSHQLAYLWLHLGLTQAHPGAGQIHLHLQVEKNRLNAVDQ